jgi:hypothetical protein
VMTPSARHCHISMAVANTTRCEPDSHQPDDAARPLVLTLPALGASIQGGSRREPFPVRLVVFDPLALAD